MSSSPEQYGLVALKEAMLTGQTYTELKVYLNACSGSSKGSSEEQALTHEIESD